MEQESGAKTSGQEEQCGQILPEEQGGKNKPVKPKTDKQNKLTEGPIVKQLVIFALPLFLSNFLQQLYNTSDAIFVGRFVSDNALTAVSQSGNVIQVLIGLFLGLGVGAGVIIGQYFGAKDKENLSKAIHTTMLMSVIFGLALTVVGILTTPLILKAIKINDEHYEYAAEYLRIYFAGISFLFIYNLGAGVLRAVGDSVSPLIFLIFTSLLDLLMNFLFVCKWRWGIAGSAWSTVIAQGLAALLVVIRLITGKRTKLRIKKLKIHKQMFKRIIKLGLPTGLQTSVISVAHLVMLYFTNGFGVEVANGMAVYGKIDAFVYMPLSSFGVSLTAFVSQNVGAGKYERAKKSIWVCIIISEIATVLLCSAVYLCNPQAIYLLTPSLSDKSEKSIKTVKYALMFMHVMVFSYPVLAINDSLSGALRGAGQTFVPSAIYISTMCGLRVLFIVTMMPIFHHPLIVMLSYPMSWVVTLISLIVYYIKSKTFAPPPAPEPLKSSEQLVAAQQPAAGEQGI